MSGLARALMVSLLGFAHGFGQRIADPGFDAEPVPGPEFNLPRRSAPGYRSRRPSGAAAAKRAKRRRRNIAKHPRGVR